MRIVLTVVFSLVVGQTVFAQRADERLAGCRVIAEAATSDGKITIPNDPDALQCWGALGVVQDFVNTFDGKTKRPFFNTRACVPSDVTRSQLAAIFVSFLDKRPERRHERFLDVMLDSLQEVYPFKGVRPCEPD